MRIMLSFLVVVLFATGCGYKGPLVLPKPKPAAQQPAPAAPAQPDATKPGDGTTKE
ncbi:MAG TPA: lipoprotein [Burkholderiales bacterium]|jgi:predicted small lipoprotein YifL|nr:lipoprotein [Burkholderiales bacterium]